MERIWRPNVTVAAVIEHPTKKNHFLCVQEQRHDGLKLNQPAGHLEENESLIDAVKREVLEETAYEFIPQHLLGLYQYQVFVPSVGEKVSFLRVAFTGIIGKHHPQQALDDGILSAKWYDLDFLRKHQEQHRSILVQQCINDYVKGMKAPLDLLKFY
jgi:8-oxo-dGTP pyrophosphatase MutT (NUDIX family)